VDVGGKESRPPKQNKELQQLLSRHSAVFKEIKGLPPIRSNAHVIVLQHGAGPVSADLIDTLIIRKMR
jgi:hypothetical protein